MNLHSVRQQFHPLNRLRRYSFARAMLNAADVPIWTRMPGVNWKVRGRLVRHASAVLLPGGVEPGIFCTFQTIAKHVGVHSFWDVGANIGYYSWFVRSLAPECSLRLFEPELENIALIKETIKRAKLTCVTLRETAVSDHHGRQEFQRDQISGSTGGIADGPNTFSERQWGITGETIIVETVSLDHERASSNPVDLIKIDVEGHEEAVIRGALETIAADQPIIVFECFHGGHEINHALAERGYQVVDAETMTEPTATTSNFVALPPDLKDEREEIAKQWRSAMAELGVTYGG